MSQQDRAQARPAPAGQPLPGSSTGVNPFAFSDCASGKACSFGGTQYTVIRFDGSCADADAGVYFNMYPYFAQSAKDRCPSRRLHEYDSSGFETACIRPDHEQPFIPGSQYYKVGGGDCS